MDQQPEIPKIDQLKSNLKAWKLSDGLIFFGIIPLLLLVIFALPQAVRSDYFIFYTSNLTRLQTFVLSGYTHSELFPHLITNLVFYLIAVSAIFTFETDRKRFWVMAAISLFVVPVICSLLTVGFWAFFNTETSMQGFSGIDAAFLAYAIMAGVTWTLSGRPELFGSLEAFTGPKRRFYLHKGLLTVMLAAIVYEGIIMGQFTSTGSATTNGIAHFGGFTTGLVSFVIFDLMMEKRKNFDVMLIISISIGVIFYIEYLVRVVKAVKGL
jgi:hypothetical protein